MSFRDLRARFVLGGVHRRGAQVMADPGPMFRRALSRLPAHFVSVDQDALCAPPRFSSTDHLATEAVAAYVDGELPMKAHLRAASHLSACPQCAAEVDGQCQARAALRNRGRSACPAPDGIALGPSRSPLRRNRRSRRRPSISRPTGPSAAVASAGRLIGNTGEWAVSGRFGVWASRTCG